MTTTDVCDTRVVESIVAMIEAANQNPMPVWGNAFVRNLNLVQHQAWHPAQGARTLERTMVNGQTERYRIVRELRLTFLARLSDKHIGEPIREDVLFEMVATLRQQCCNRTVCQLTLTHHAEDHEGRTHWTRHFSGQPTVHHFMAPKGSNKFRGCQPGSEQARMVSSMERDLRPGFVPASVGHLVTTPA